MKMITKTTKLLITLALCLMTLSSFSAPQNPQNKSSKRTVNKAYGNGLSGGGNVLTDILRDKIKVRWDVIRNRIKYNYYFMSSEVVNNIARYKEVLEKPAKEVISTTREELQAFDKEQQKMRDADAVSYPVTQTTDINEYSLSSILQIGGKCDLDRLLFHEISVMLELEGSFDFSLTNKNISYICGTESKSLAKGLIIINSFYTPEKVDFEKTATELGISKYNAGQFSLWAYYVIRKQKTLNKSLLEQKPSKGNYFTYIKPGENFLIRKAFCDTEFVQVYAEEMGFVHLINFNEICSSYDR